MRDTLAAGRADLMRGQPCAITHSSSENWRGRIALMVGHCAGMVDLVALPVWMGA
jgi:hypothetical protein